MKTETEKLKLEKETPQPLKIFFMIARLSPINIQQEAVLAVLSYTLEDAINKAKQQAQNYNIVYHGQFVEVNEMLKKLQLESIIVPPVKETITKKPRTSKEQFLWDLELTANEYLKGKDKETLKEIIKKCQKTTH